MENNLVFIDTSGFKAVVDKNDEFHWKAAKIWRKLKEEKAILVTSNYILDETFTLLRARCGIKAVLKFRKILAKSSRVLKVVRVTLADEAGAWKWFVKNWSGLSFTDCVSLALMKRLGIKKVVSFDRHFSRAGMEAVK
ncbi:MAG: type II toxin-antitoxin system VapC family toxin [Microgenomates group bacterium]